MASQVSKNKLSQNGVRKCSGQKRILEEYLFSMHQHKASSCNKVPDVDSHSVEEGLLTRQWLLETQVHRCGQSRLHLLLLYTIILALLLSHVVLQRGECSDPSQGIYSPAQDVISYKTTVFAENFVTKGPYMGREEDGLPTDEVDRLWEDLYQYGISHIPANEAARLPNRTTAIPTMPNDFVIQLDVFHQLHCLNAVRKTLFPERYWREYDDYLTAEGERNYTSTSAKHFDHCIDSIRQSIMCHGDIATVYWQWMPVRQQPLPRLEITHTCRDFDAIRDWAKEHRLKMDEVMLQWRPGPEESFLLSR